MRQMVILGAQGKCWGNVTVCRRLGIGVNRWAVVGGHGVVLGLFCMFSVPYGQVGFSQLGRSSIQGRLQQQLARLPRLRSFVRILS